MRHLLFLLAQLLPLILHPQQAPIWPFPADIVAKVSYEKVSSNTYALKLTGDINADYLMFTATSCTTGKTWISNVMTGLLTINEIAHSDRLEFNSFLSSANTISVAQLVDLTRWRDTVELTGITGRIFMLDEIILKTISERREITCASTASIADRDLPQPWGRFAEPTAASFQGNTITSELRTNYLLAPNPKRRTAILSFTHESFFPRQVEWLGEGGKVRRRWTWQQKEKSCHVWLDGFAIRKRHGTVTLRITDHRGVVSHFGWVPWYSS